MQQVSVPDDQFRFEILSRSHDRTTFSCGVAALDRYFREQASQDQRRRIAVPYVLVAAATGAVAGYYTLSTSTLVLDNLPPAAAHRLPRYPVLPAILIGRLAADQRYRGQGLGAMLLLDALFRAYDVSLQVGSVAVLVQAKDAGVRGFYERYGFRSFQDRENDLFLKMEDVAKMKERSL